VTQLMPLYWIRAIGGLLYLTGAIMLLLNFVMTWMDRPKKYEEVVHTAPALKRRREQRVEKEPSRLHANTNLGHAGDRFLQASWHRRMEGRPIKFMIWVLIAVAIGGIVEIIPMFLIRSNVPTISTVTPYTPLELAGRDIYVAEGCYNCHSQMIRPLFAETERYGEYSKPGEFVYDHPFQWGSRRIGPDLAREGRSNPNPLWHYDHFKNPREVNSGSIMPAFPWLFTKKINFDRIQTRVNAMAMLGVPYGQAVLEGMAPKLAQQQAQEIARLIDEAGGPPADSIWDTEVIALIAYMRRLGTDIFKTPSDSAQEGTGNAE
jgi:cytochrome c oxidase cbb3-type subunit I/II